jgi:hypothetical protein
MKLLGWKLPLGSSKLTLEQARLKKKMGKAENLYRRPIRIFIAAHHQIYRKRTLDVNTADVKYLLTMLAATAS